MNLLELAEAAVARAEKAGAIAYNVVCEQEQLWPGECFASGDDEHDAETVAKILRDYDNGNDWAWCTAVVSCCIPGYDAVGRDYLGCCSCDSKEDFRLNSGYYLDMCYEARDNLVREIVRVLEEENKRI